MRRRLAKGEVGIEERIPVPTLREFAPRFEQAIEVQCAEKPSTVKFYQRKLKTLLANDSLAAARLNTIEERSIEASTEARSRITSRRKKPLAPGPINRELATLRRLLRLAHEWKLIQRVPRVRLLRGGKRREFVFESSTGTGVSGRLFDDAIRRSGAPAQYWLAPGRSS